MFLTGPRQFGGWWDDLVNWMESWFEVELVIPPQAQAPTAYQARIMQGPGFWQGIYE